MSFTAFTNSVSVLNWVTRFFTSSKGGFCIILGEYSTFKVINIFYIRLNIQTNNTITMFKKSILLQLDLSN
jgi:hypothetical protein